MGVDQLEALVQWMQERADGWVRIVPGASGETHWKWRWTSGQWAGHYEYWCQPHWQSAGEALVGLQGKLRAVDQGLKRPSKDNYY